MTKINNPYLTIINANTKYDPETFKNFEFETVSVTDGDWGKTLSKLEKNTKKAYDCVLKDFKELNIDCKLMSSKRTKIDQLYAQGETMLKSLNDNVTHELKEQDGNFNNNKRYVKLAKKLVAVIKNPKQIKIAYDYQKKYAARIGHSEHHSGLAIDIKVDMNNAIIPDKISEKYGDAGRGALNFMTRRLVMEKHGFILSYPVDERLEKVTGFTKPEGWHWRYIGPEHSQRIAKIREELVKAFGEKHEVFLEDYVQLLNYNVEANSEQELVQKYTEIFAQKILRLKNKNKDENSLQV